MAQIEIKGTIIPSNYQRAYDFIGYEGTSPIVVKEALGKANGNEVEVIINSSGGDVFAGVEIYSLLRNYQGKITVKIFSLAASAASVIAMAGDEILMSPGSQMMIHNVSTVARGDYRSMLQSVDVLRNANTALANTYVIRTGKTYDEIYKLMDAETWFNVQTAVEQGFADGLLFEDSRKVPSNIDHKEDNKKPTELEIAKANFELLKLKGVN